MSSSETCIKFHPSPVNPLFNDRIAEMENLGKLPNEPNGFTMAEQSDGSGGLGKLPNEPNGRVTEVRSESPGGSGKLPNEANGLQTEVQSEGPGDLGKLPNEPNGLATDARSEGSGDLGRLPNEPNEVQIADRAGELGRLEAIRSRNCPRSRAVDDRWGGLYTPRKRGLAPGRTRPVPVPVSSAPRFHGPLPSWWPAAPEMGTGTSKTRSQSPFPTPLRILFTSWKRGLAPGRTRPVPVPVSSASAREPQPSPRGSSGPIDRQNPEADPESAPPLDRVASRGPGG